MTTADSIQSKGQVSPSFINLKTGEKVPWPKRHNTISFDATRAMALAFGGDDSLIPNRIGIVYGDTDDTTFATIGRDQEWDDLVYTLTQKNADVQVKSFSYSPSFKKMFRVGSKTVPVGSSSSMPGSDSSDPDAAQYPGWAVTFHSHSDSTTPGEIGKELSASPSDEMIFTTGKYIFQAVLLNYSNGKYTILARSSLDSTGDGCGTYYTKPENFEVAIDWTIKFF